MKEIIKETDEAITIVFDKSDLIYEPGQFLTLLMTIDEQEVRRSYSLCTSPHTDQYPAVTVKRVASGKVSNFLSDTLKVGDAITIQAPAGNFTTDLHPNQARHLVMFGGGSGITPIMSLIKSVLNKEPASKISLIYANRDEDTIIFREHLHQLLSRYPERFHLVHMLENVTTRFACRGGLITPEAVPDLLADLPFQEKTTEYFLCGPQGMMDNVLDGLRALEIPTHLIHKESFVAGAKKDKETRRNQNSSYCLLGLRNHRGRFRKR